MMVLCVVLVHFAGNLQPLSQAPHVMRCGVDLNFHMCPYVVSGEWEVIIYNSKCEHVPM